MRTRSYIDKMATIMSESEINTGMNPVGRLYYGDGFSRILVHFDIDRIKGMVDDKTFADRGKLTHKLKLYNAGLIDFSSLHCSTDNEIGQKDVKRAASFDLIFFRIPKSWDNGKGVEYTRNTLIRDFYSKPCGNGCREYGVMASTDGANWYQRRNGLDWDEEGVFTNERLAEEYQKFGTGDESVIIARQRFDLGNEDVDIDITCYVEGVIDGEYENNGIGIAFAPSTEWKETETCNYVGFCSHFNPTFFQPYVETTYDEPITDDRGHFYCGRKNRLYLYVEEDGNGINLDELPKCEVDGVEREVRQSTKGVYYAEVTIPKGKYRNDTMLYDVWSGISVGGVGQGDVELDFTVKNDGYLNIGNSTANQKTFTVSTYGIDQKEHVTQGDKRKVGVVAKENYKKGFSDTVGFLEYRLFVMDGTREITVFDWEKVNTGLNENYFVIDTDDLVPQRYYIDIKVKYGQNSIIHHKALEFDVVGQKNNLFD